MNKKYIFLSLFIIIFLFIMYIFIMLVLLNRKETIYYSKEKQEAINNNTLIGSYKILKNNDIIEEEGIMVCAIVQKSFFYKEKDLSRKHIVIKFNDIKNNKWEAYFMKEQLMIFEEKKNIYILGVEENMDSIEIIKDGKEKYRLIKNPMLW